MPARWPGLAPQIFCPAPSQRCSRSSLATMEIDWRRERRQRRGDWLRREQGTRKVSGQEPEERGLREKKTKGLGGGLVGRGRGRPPCSHRASTTAADPPGHSTVCSGGGAARADRPLFPATRWRPVEVGRARPLLRPSRERRRPAVAAAER